MNALLFTDTEFFTQAEEEKKKREVTFVHGSVALSANKCLQSVFELFFRIASKLTFTRDHFLPVFGF